MPVPEVASLPVVRGLPKVGVGVPLLLDPTAWFRRARARHGDTFVADAFGYRMVCVFSPEGVRALYALEERDASFGLATYRLIKFKMPEELLIGRRVTPHQLFGRQLTESYLTALDDAMTLELAALGSRGELEVFAEMRRVAHRLGLMSWGGPELARRVDQLAPLLDALDSAEAFVRPVQAFRTAATKRRAERAALAQPVVHHVDTLSLSFGVPLGAVSPGERDVEPIGPGSRKACRGRAVVHLDDADTEEHQGRVHADREVGSGPSVVSARLDLEETVECAAVVGHEHPATHHLEAERIAEAGSPHRGGNR
jgi:hypothetical protein